MVPNHMDRLRTELNAIAPAANGLLRQVIELFALRRRWLKRHRWVGDASRSQKASPDSRELAQEITTATQSFLKSFAGRPRLTPLFRDALNARRQARLEIADFVAPNAYSLLYEITRRVYVAVMLSGIKAVRVTNPTNGTPPEPCLPRFAVDTFARRLAKVVVTRTHLAQLSAEVKLDASRLASALAESGAARRQPSADRANLRRKSSHCRRPKPLNDVDRDIYAMRLNGDSLAVIGRKYGIKKQSVARRLKRIYRLTAEPRSVRARTHLSANE